MFSNLFLCVLLVCGLVMVPTNGDETARKPGNFIPKEEWDEERLAEWYKAKKASQSAGVNMDEAKAEIDHMNRVTTQYVRENNCAGIIGLYDPNVMIIHSDRTTKGLEAIQFVMGELEYIGTMNMTSLAVSPLGKDGKFVFQHAYGSAHDKEGNLLYTGDSFVIWKRHNDGLKVYIEIYDLD